MSYIKMNNFDQSIDSIRNILRTEGITGMESINHCVLFIIFRSLSEFKCIEYNIPTQYAFEKFKYDEQTKKDLLTNDQKLFDKFFLKDKECLIKQIKQKLGFSQINFKIKSLQYFEKIYKILESLNINNLEENFDIIGIIYELHLRSGLSGSGMRDLGQYFTNRLVIEYMVKLCNPKVKENGEIEKILDPSMGTGGFLTMSIKHLNENNKNINWNANKNNIYGFDIDENLKNLALLNVLLETGKDFKKTIVQCDSLKNDYLVDKDNKTVIDKVDIILANEPFGLKNIIHADCCDRIKDLKIRGTKGEPLFLQLMMLSLNKGGRCAVVVPDGVLFNDAKLHKDTRKYLCEKLNLKKVVSLEDGLFLNTGVKSSILFFVNDGETEEVEFCKIKMSNGEIVEESVIIVDIEEIEQNDYSLFVNKYNIIEEEKIEGIEYKKLGDVCEIITGDRQEIRLDIGYPVYGGGGISYYTDKYNTDENTIILSRVGLTKSTMLNFINQKIWLLDSGFKLILKNKTIVYKYLYYILYNLRDKIISIGQGSAQKTINKLNLNQLQIPIPPLSLQQQIVEALDSIYDTIEGNNKLIQNYDKIKKGIIWSNTLNVEKKKMVDIAEMKIGGTPRRDTEIYWKNGKNLWVSISELNNNIICDTKEKITDEGVNKSNVKLVKKDTILMSFKMSLGKKAIAGKDLYTNEAIVAINGKNVLNKYIYYSIDRFDFSQACSSIATGNLNKEKLEELLIPIPSKQIQEHIVKECEYYDNLIDTLKKENERLQNNKIIDMVLKSVSNEMDDQQDGITQYEISEDESEEEKPQPKKTTKETNKVKEILKQVIEKEELDEHHLKKSKESLKKKKSKSEKTTDI